MSRASVIPTHRIAGGEHLAGRFAAAERDGRAAFVAYLTAGDPSLSVTAGMLPMLEDQGVDVVEVGVPFSDPIADGPVIQRASQRSLKGGTTLFRVLDLISRYRKAGGRLGIVLFSYLNPIHRFGYERFADAAARSGVDGVLLTDLPIDEPEPLRPLLTARGVATIPLLSPTSGPLRLRAAAENGSGFVYVIARTGVTGAGAGTDEGLPKLIASIRKVVPLPVAVGFGLSTAEQVAAVAQIADGVVVGSALVAAIESAPAGHEVRTAKEHLRPLLGAARRG